MGQVLRAVDQYGLKFGKSKIVMTRNGEREVASAAPTPEFWEAWRADKEAVRKMGLGVSRNDGIWEVSLWRQTMSREERAAAADASRATDAQIDVPLPPGLALMPFQRAGVAYALRRLAGPLQEKGGQGPSQCGVLIADEMGL